MSKEMTRKEVIYWLYRLKSHLPTFMPKIWHEKFIKALQLAIASLETDEAYQLEYENPTFCEDCISRQAVLNKILKFSVTDGRSVSVTNLWTEVNELPSVTSQEPKTGHWTEEFDETEGEVRFTCSCCGKYQLFDTDFCYNCGAKMVEQESEDNNAEVN